MRHHLVVVSFVAVVLATVGATASQNRSPQRPPAPAKTPVGEFVWHDLITHDVAACRQFYGALFGWTFDDGVGIDPGYTIIKQAERPIGGIVARPSEGGEAAAQWLAYVVVVDVDRAATAFQRAGGHVYRGPLDARKDLRVAVVADAQGAALGLANRGQPGEQVGVPGLHRWLWMEYVAKDPASALTFYGEAVGFAHEVSEVREDFTYYLLSTDRPRAGLFQSPWARDRSVWLPYIRVEDPAAMAARAVELGGSIAVQPQPRIRNGSMAVILDPTGAPLALQKFPFNSAEVP